jgi:F-type H+-transporting ATPase subunit b
LLAEDAARGGWLWNLDLWRVINLLVFVAVLAYIFRNKLKIGQVFESRARQISNDLESAKQEKVEARQRLAEIDARLSRLDEDIAAIRAEAKEEAEREAERIKQAAQADAEKIQQMARREMEGAMRAARAELRAFVAEHSIQIAAGLIKQEMRPEDNRRIITDYLNQLEKVSE